MKKIQVVNFILSTLLFFGVGCSSTTPPPDGAVGDAMMTDVAMTDMAGNTGDGGAKDQAMTSNDTGGACPQATGPLPATQLTVDGKTYYQVLGWKQPDPNMFRYQLNFGTEAQYRMCEGEPGQNSSFIVVVSFKTQPSASGTFNYTDKRFVENADGVNFYMTFFKNKGTGRDDKNYLTPASGQMTLTVDGKKYSAPVTNITMTNEADGADTFSLTGTLSFTL